MNSPKSIPVSAAAEQFRAKTRILDVRTPAEFESIHVEGSLLSPLGEIDPQALKKSLDPDSPLLVMCRSGKRATAACEAIAAHFPKAQVVEGGIEAWAAAGHPILRGRSVVSLERQVRIAAGALIVIGSLLAWKVNPGFLALPAFVGAGLMFAGITDSCGMGMLLAKMPWNRSGGSKAKAALATA